MKKKKGIIAGAVIAGAIGGSVYAAYSGGLLKSASTAAEATETPGYKETTVERGNLMTGVEESGAISIGSVTQICSLSGEDSLSAGSSSAAGSTFGSASGSMSMSGGSGSSQGSGSSAAGSLGSSSSSGSSAASSAQEVSLTVEEVYAAVGQRVEAGDPLMKLSEESIDEYRAALEKAAADAELAVKQAKITREENAVNYEYDYQSNLARGEVAQAEYDSTIAGLENQVTDIQALVDDSLETIADLTQRLADGEDVEEELETEQKNYADLCTRLLTAQNNLITGSITAKQNYDLAMLNYENADSLYEIGTNDLDSDLENAQNALEAAKEELEAFEAFVGDGTIDSEYSGIVTEVGFAEGDALTDAAVIAGFQNAEDVTMAVSVNQEDISKIAVGDRAVVKLTAYEGTEYEGIVQSIAVSSESGSSTVNYTVTVLLTGDVSRVFADMTGSAVFVEDEAADVLYVSARAIIQDGDASYAKVLEDDGTIRMQEVETGFSDGYQIEIRSGLEEGQTVIIESQVKQS